MKRNVAAVATAAVLLASILLALWGTAALVVHVKNATGIDIQWIAVMPFGFFVAVLYGWQKVREQRRR